MRRCEEFWLSNAILISYQTIMFVYLLIYRYTKTRESVRVFLFQMH